MKTLKGYAYDARTVEALQAVDEPGVYQFLVCGASENGLLQKLWQKKCLEADYQRIRIIL